MSYGRRDKRGKLSAPPLELMALLITGHEAVGKWTVLRRY